jgi:HD-GYP domain-containing protein (c-di-GMP phosphodiesterase class II)
VDRGYRMEHYDDLGSSASTTLDADVVLVDGLVTMVRQRDPITASHLDAVGLLSRRLAVQLDLEPVTVARITNAARLHDIGKQTISLDILNKSEKLDDEEWHKIRQHPDYGAAIVSGFPQLEKYRAIVRSHHERVDGRGYPDGLLGPEIPYEARIIAVADAFHAMTVSRPYSRVRTPALALAELMNCSGTQFEPEYVEAFVKLMGYRSRSLRSA